MLAKLSPFNPAYQVVQSNTSDAEDVEFDFWGAREVEYYDSFGDGWGSRIEFQAKFEDECDGQSPLLWRTLASRNYGYESTPFGPCYRNYGNLSPTSRLQVLAKARRELMEMVCNMPESSYELSLKDIVDENQGSQGKKEELAVEDPGFHLKSETKAKRRMKKATSFNKSGPISRTGSMEKETFMIKMFLPTSFGWKTKVTAEHGSKISRRSSFDGSEKYADKKSIFRTSSVSGHGKNGESGRSRSSSRTSSSSSSRTSSSSNSTSSRLVKHGNGNFFLGCWPFSCNGRSKTKRAEDAYSIQQSKVFATRNNSLIQGG